MIEIKDIGKLTQRISIYTQVLSASTTTGERTQSFTLLGTYWAAVEFGSGNETVSDDMAYGIQRLFVTIVYNSSVTDTSMVVWDLRNYDIRAIEYDDRKMFMKLSCEAAK